jgi:hypothetical protein
MTVVMDHEFAGYGLRFEPIGSVPIRSEAGDERRMLGVEGKIRCR